VPHTAPYLVIESHDDASRQAARRPENRAAPRAGTGQEMLSRAQSSRWTAPTCHRIFGEAIARGAALNHYPSSRPITTAHRGLPIMHVTPVPRNRRRHPWVVEAWCLAFDERSNSPTGASPPHALCWYPTYWEEERALLGPALEFGPFGSEQAQLRTLVRWVHAQVLTGAKPELEDLFRRKLPARARARAERLQVLERGARWSHDAHRFQVAAAGCDCTSTFRRGRRYPITRPTCYRAGRAVEDFLALAKTLGLERFSSSALAYGRTTADVDAMRKIGTKNCPRSSISKRTRPRGLDRLNKLGVRGVRINVRR